MTVLTIITNSNDHTVYFEKPLERGFEYIRLISCSLYNSWYNLKEKGEIGFVDNSGITTTKRIPPGELEEIFNDEGIEVKFDDASGPMGLLQLAVTWYMLEGKLPTGTSKTKRLHQDKFEFSLFWMSQWAACPPAWTM